MLRAAAAFVIWAALALVVALGGCRRHEESASASASVSCGLTEDGGVLEVAGRGDGVYGVRGDRVDSIPFAHFERTERLSEGVDATSGKRWIQMRLAPDEALAVRELTADPTGKRIAVVAGGEIASVHKIRQPITSGDVQVSCCNPRACDRWNAQLSRPR